MFANKIDADGHPICICGQPVQPNDTLPEGSDQRGVLTQGTKGLVILHAVCLEMHNVNVMMERF